MPIRHILFTTLISFRYVGIKQKIDENKIAFSPEEIETEINRRLGATRNHNPSLFNFYLRIMENYHP